MPRVTLLLLVALALLAPAASAARMEIPVTLHELGEGRFHLLPERMNAGVGDTVVLHVTNAPENTVAHDLMVCGDRLDIEPDCEDVWLHMQPIPVDATAVGEFKPKRAGAFEFYSTGPGEKFAGMKGTLVVAETKNESPAGPVAIAGLVLAALAFARRWRL